MSEPIPPSAASPARTNDAITSSAADPKATTDDRPTATPPAVPLAGAERYVLGEEIARGGMGAVYRATDTVLGREVAVKVLQDKYAPGSGTARRFADEARIAAQLQHPGIPPVHDLGTLSDGRPFLAMKLIKGQTLDQLLRGRNDVATERGRLVAVFEQVCQALAYAHNHGVIHRDLKPANVMVGAFGEVQVMDWGLAKVLGARTTDTLGTEAPVGTQVVSLRDSDGQFTEAGSVLGTPAYMPPEQAIGAVDQIDARSDVFGLGGILASILTGQPPFVGDSAEGARQLAARGKVQDCLARLDACGADPELVALCKRCLAPEKTDRPADAGAVASAVAALRAAADERARRAELEKVRVAGEKAAAEARSLERRKRRRVWLLASAALVLAVLAGLGAVLWVQHRGNLELEGKNQELAEQEKEVEARFELAQRAIATFHTGVSKDALLKNPDLSELRTRLLKEAAGFYGDLEKLLAGKTEPKSRRLLAAGYSQLGDLSQMFGDVQRALAAHRQALALRRELAAAPGADVETRLDVARSLYGVAQMLITARDMAAALAADEEGRDIALALEAEAPTEAVREVLARGHTRVGWILTRTGRQAEALEPYHKAVGIYQQLVDTNPRSIELHVGLGTGLRDLGWVLYETGTPEEALQVMRKAAAVHQKVADASPDTEHRTQLAWSHQDIGEVLWRLGRLPEALQAMEKARDIEQQVAQASPAVVAFQSNLGTCYGAVGAVLYEMDRLPEAIAAYEKARDVHQKVADNNPMVPLYRWRLTIALNNLGEAQARRKLFREAFAALDQSQKLLQQLADDHPTFTDYITFLGIAHTYRGWAHVRAGHPVEATADLRRALEVWAQVKVLPPDVQYEQVRALALLAGLGAEAKSGVTAAEAAAFADQAIAALQGLIAAGWGQANKLKEPDFDALRQRDDFQKLHQELEARGANRASPDQQPQPGKM
jgi:tetratricopeptide (TPR) repeat protein